MHSLSWRGAGHALAHVAPTGPTANHRGPLSFSGSLSLNGNKVIFNAARYRGSLGGLLLPELHLFRVACRPWPRTRLTRQLPSLERAARWWP